MPLGHWQPLTTHTAGQTNNVFMLAHVVLQGEAQSTRIWPPTGQSKITVYTYHIYDHESLYYCCEWYGLQTWALADN